MRPTLRDKLATLRPPPASGARQARSNARDLPDVLSIATPAMLPIVARAMFGDSTEVLVLPASTLQARGPDASFARALIRSASSAGVVTVGSRATDGWATVACELGTHHLELGAAGWVHVEIAERACLGQFFLPLELELAPAVIAVADAGGDRALGFWRSVAHPHSALQVLLGGNAARIDLLTAIQATYAFNVGPRAAPLIAWVADPVAAELAMLASRYLADDCLGYEQRLPWEDARVQMAAERGLGASGHHQLRMRAMIADNEGIALEYVAAIARLLGSALEVSNCEG